MTPGTTWKLPTGSVVRIDDVLLNEDLNCVYLLGGNVSGVRFTPGFFARHAKPFKPPARLSDVVATRLSSRAREIRVKQAPIVLEDGSESGCVGESL